MADRYADLRAASLAITGWDGINQSWQVDDRDGCDVMFEVGAINDGEKYPVAVIDADTYGTDGESQKLAHYYAEANPQAIRALLTDYDRLRDALYAAQRSLNTIAILGGSTDDFMGTMRQVRAYANSRARVARAALTQEQGESK